MEKLRVLCLHGYRGSAELMRRQLAALADGADDLATFAYLDAPSLAAGDFGWWHAKAVESADAGAIRGGKHYEGWRRTIDAIVSSFALQGPFDGVLGFSQGAALASLLGGLRSNGGRAGSEPAGPIGGFSSHGESLAFDFAVMVGGFVVADAELARLYGERSNDLPSAHIIGRSDSVVPKAASLALASKFKDPLILEHEGGHVIPDAPHIRQGFRGFLEEMRQRRKVNMLPR
jgi:pimeloyl-ACP methyl ester carboxylesterase